VKIGEIWVSLGLSTASFTKGMSDMRSLSFGTSREISRSFDIMAKGLVGATAAFVAALGAMAVSSLKAAAQVHEASQAAGTTAESFTRLAYAAKLSGIDQESLGKGLTRLSKSMLEASTGGQDQQRIFRALGISYKDAAGNLRPVEDVLLGIAERFKGMKDGAEKTAVAQKLFRDTAFIDFLNQGSDAMRQMAGEADKLGVTLSGKTTAAADRVTDNIDRMGTVARAAGNELLKNLLPAIDKLAEKGARTAKDTEFGKNFMRGFLFGGMGAAAIIRDEAEATKKAGGEFGIFGEKAAEVTAGQKTLGMANVLAAEAFEKARQKVKDFTQALNDQVAIQGQNVIFANAYRAAQIGATAADQEHIKVLSRKLFFFQAMENLKAPNLPKIPITMETLPSMAVDQLKPPPGLEELMRPSAAEGERALQQWREFQAIVTAAMPKLSHLKALVFELKEGMKEFNTHAVRAFGEWLIAGGSVRQMLTGLLQDLARMVFEILVVQSLKAVFSNLFAAEGAIIPGRASGGPVMGNGPFIVGERGPELFMPPGPGMIIPNHALPDFRAGGMGGGIVQNIAIDNRGADAGTVLKTTQLVNRLAFREFAAMMADRQLRTA